MRAVCAVLLCIACTGQVQAQSYSITRVEGPQPYTAEIREQGEVILLGPVNQVLTTWQELPFPFRFFGEVVTGYKVSDNGYLTFDQNETRSIGSNANLGSTVVPNNAIYGFWEELEIFGNAPEYRQQIRSRTIGTAPDRIHVVMWMGVTSRATPGGEIHFAIALKEAGGFAIVQTQRSSTNVYAGAIGAENHDGTASVWVDGSPTLDFPTMWTKDEDDVTYEFASMEGETDLQLLALLVPDLVQVSGEYPVGVIVQSNGGIDVASADVELTYEDIQTTLSISASLTPNGWDTLWLDQPLPAGTAGSGREITARIVAVNGGVDDHPENDTLRRTTWFNRGASVERTPLVEKFTGAWCGFCADGSRVLTLVAEAEPDAIYVAHHIGGLDSMKTEEGVALGRAFRSGTPMAMFDRTLMSGLARIPISRGNDAWFRAVQLRQEQGAVATLSVEPAVYWATNRIGARVQVTFVDDVVPADYRVHVLIVEDSVSGDGPGFDQRNYYGGDERYRGHPLFEEEPWITNFQHRFVARYHPTGTWGDSTTLPARPIVGEPYELMVDQFVDFEVNINRVSIVAYVTRHHPDDPRQRPVLNAAEVHALSPVSVSETESQNRITIGPNPVRDVLTIDGASGPIRIVDLFGRCFFHRMLADGASMQLPVTSWPTGTYLLLHDGSPVAIQVIR